MFDELPGTTSGGKALKSRLQLRGSKVEDRISPMARRNQWDTAERALDQLLEHFDTHGGDVRFVLEHEAMMAGVLSEISANLGLSRYSFSVADRGFPGEEALIRRVAKGYGEFAGETVTGPLANEIFRGKNGKAHATKISEFSAVPGQEIHDQIAYTKKGGSILVLTEKKGGSAPAERVLQRAISGLNKGPLDKLHAVMGKFEDFYEVLNEQLIRSGEPIFYTGADPSTVIKHPLISWQASKHISPYGQIIWHEEEKAHTERDIEAFQSLQQTRHRLIVNSITASDDQSGIREKALRAGVWAYEFNADDQRAVAMIRRALKERVGDLAAYRELIDHHVRFSLGRSHELVNATSADETSWGTAGNLERYIATSARTFPFLGELGVASDGDYRRIFENISSALREGVGIYDPMVVDHVHTNEIESAAITKLRKKQAKGFSAKDQKTANQARKDIGESIADRLDAMYARGIFPIAEEFHMRYGSNVYLMTLEVSPEQHVRVINKVVDDKSAVETEQLRHSMYSRNVSGMNNNLVITPVTVADGRTRYVLSSIVGGEHMENLLDRVEEDYKRSVASAGSSKVHGPEERYADIAMTFDRLGEIHAQAPLYNVAEQPSTIELTDKVMDVRFVKSLLDMGVLDAKKDKKIVDDIRLGHTIIAKSFEDQPVTALVDAYFANFRKDVSHFPAGESITKFDEMGVRVGPVVFDVATPLSVGGHVSTDATYDLKRGLEVICDVKTDKSLDQYRRTNEGRKELKALGFNPSEISDEASVSDRELFERRSFRAYNQAIAEKNKESKNLRKKKEAYSAVVSLLDRVQTPEIKKVKKEVKKNSAGDPLEEVLIYLSAIAATHENHDHLRQYRDLARECVIAKYRTGSEIDLKLRDVLIAEKNLRPAATAEVGDVLEKITGKTFVAWGGTNSKERYARVVSELRGAQRAAEKKNHAEAVSYLGELIRYIDEVTAPAQREFRDYNHFVEAKDAAYIHRAMCHWSNRVKAKEDMGYQQRRDSAREELIDREMDNILDISHHIHSHSARLEEKERSKTALTYNGNKRGYLSAAESKHLFAKGNRKSGIQVGTALTNFAEAMDIVKQKYEAFKRAA